MVEPEIPNRGERLSVGDKGAERSGQSATNAIIPCKRNAQRRHVSDGV